jgi:hypothetical protein
MGEGTVVGRKYKEDEGACGRGLLRSYLYVFNVFLLVASLVVGALGVYSILAEVLRITIS